MPYWDPDGTFAKRIIPPSNETDFRRDYDACAAALIYLADQIRLGDQRCSACLDAEEHGPR